MLPEPRAEIIAALHTALTDLTVAHTLLQLNSRLLRALAGEGNSSSNEEREPISEEQYRSDIDLLANMRIAMDRLMIAVTRLRDVEAELRDSMTPPSE